MAVERVRGWARVWRDLRERRPVFELVDDVSSPLWYRGRPFPLDRLPVAGPLRIALQQWVDEPRAPDGEHLARALAEAMRAPVAFDGVVHRPHR